ELDLELPVNDLLMLPDQLIRPWFLDLASPLEVDIEAMRITRGVSIEADLESDGFSSRNSRHDQVDVSRMKPVADLAAGLFQRDRFLSHGPIARSAPVVEPSFRGILPSLSAEVGLRRLQRRPIGGRLEPGAGDRNQSITNAPVARRDQELLNSAFR